MVGRRAPGDPAFTVLGSDMERCTTWGNIVSTASSTAPDRSASTRTSAVLERPVSLGSPLWAEPVLCESASSRAVAASVSASVTSRNRSPMRAAYEVRNELRNDRVRERPAPVQRDPSRVTAEVACTNREVKSVSTASRSGAKPRTVANPSSCDQTTRHRLAPATALSSIALGDS